MDAANYTILGSDSQAYAELLVRLGDMAWSSCCDKYGDWAISTQDDCPLADLQERVGQVGEIQPGGEMKFTIEELLPAGVEP